MIDGLLPTDHVKPFWCQALPCGSSFFVDTASPHLLSLPSVDQAPEDVEAIANAEAPQLGMLKLEISEVSVQWVFTWSVEVNHRRRIIVWQRPRSVDWVDASSRQPSRLCREATLGNYMLKTSQDYQVPHGVCFCQFFCVPWQWQGKQNHLGIWWVIQSVSGEYFRNEFSNLGMLINTAKLLSQHCQGIPRR